MFKICNRIRKHAKTEQADQQRHDYCKAVNLKREVETQERQPLDGFARRGCGPNSLGNDC